MKHGFIKVAAAAPEIRVADPMFNADAVIRAMDEPARPVTMMAVRTGPSSRMSVNETAAPKNPTEPNFTKT